MVSAKRFALWVAAPFLAAGSLTSVSAATQTHEIWVLDQIFYETPKELSITTEIVKTQTIGALIAVLQNHHIPFDRATKRLDTSLLPPEIYSQISAVPADEPFIAPNGDQSVASVIVGHEPAPEAGEPTGSARQGNGPPHE